jgi:hypothetical protein
MSKVKEILEDLKLALGFSVSEEVKVEEAIVEELKFVDIVAGEVLIRVIGDIMVGAVVSQVIEDATGVETENALPDGDYTFVDNDGDEFTMSVANGIITAVVQAPEAPETEVEDEMMSEVEQVKFEDVVSGDIIIRVDGVVVIGASVAEVSVDAAGTEVLAPLADGDYVYTKDGVDYTMTVVNSTITELTEVVKAEVEKVEEVNSIELGLVEMSSLIKESFEKQNIELEVLKAELEVLRADFKVMAGMPGAEAVKMSKTVKEISKENTNKGYDKLFNILKK